MRVTATTRIAAPPEKVFDMLADLRNDTRWNSRVSSAELRSPEPIALGSRFAIVNGGTPYDVTVTTYDRPSRLVFEASGNPDLTIACTITPRGDETELESDFDFRARGALKILFPLLGPVIRRDVPKQYASFKALCERGPDPVETYRRKVEQIPEQFPSVPEGYTVEHLSWEEYKDSGLPDAELAGGLGELMSPKELQKVWFDVLRDPDGNIVAERDQSGGRWWTPEEQEAETQAMWEFEDEI